MKPSGTPHEEWHSHSVAWGGAFRSCGRRRESVLGRLRDLGAFSFAPSSSSSSSSSSISAAESLCFAVEARRRFAERAVRAPAVGLFCSQNVPCTEPYAHYRSDLREGLLISRQSVR